MKKTRRSLFASLTTLLLCFAMFIGSTFAWFTDTVSNTGNRIQAGTLEIGLEQFKKTTEHPEGEFVDISGSDEPVFNYSMWEPGYSQYAVIKLSNEGNLALKFKLLLKVNGSLEENTEGHTLADAIEVYGFKTTSEDAAKSAYGKTTFAEFTALEDVEYLGSLTSFLFDEDGVAYGALLPNGESFETIPVGNVYAVVALHMKEEAGNEYQKLGLGTTFDIVAQATQFTYEKDGFGSEQYDILADGTPDHPEFDHESAIPTIKKLVLPTDGESKVVSTTTTVANKGLTVEFPAGTKLSEDTEEADDNKSADAQLGFEYISDEARGSGIEVSDNQSVMSFELTLNAANNNDTLIKFSYNIGKGLIAPEVYHDGTLLKAADNVSDNPDEESSHYDEATGTLTAWVYHASPIEIVYYPTIPEGFVAQIGNNFYDSLEAALEAAKDLENPVVNLCADITEVDERIQLEIEGLVLNGKGHSISRKNNSSAKSDALLGITKLCTIKDLTLDGTNSTGSWLVLCQGAYDFSWFESDNVNKITFDGVKITNSSCTYAIDLFGSYVHVAVKGDSEFFNNNGYCFNISDHDKKITIDGGKFHDNSKSVIYSGTGAGANSSTIRINGGSFYNNTAEYGTVIYSVKDQKLHVYINGGEFYNNQAKNGSVMYYNGVKQSSTNIVTTGITATSCHDNINTEGSNDIYIAN